MTEMNELKNEEIKDFLTAKKEAYKTEEKEKQLIEKGYDPKCAISIEQYFDPNKTDIGNAERFKYYVGHDCLYCSPFKKWFIWDGQRWAEDRNNAES